ncbi:MAG: site-2 protease family protein [Candidatus Woesearchaeota archaeon]
MKFSHIEIHELLKAWIGVSLVFAIAMVGLKSALFVALPIALVTGGIGFLLHELAHKYVAQRYRCWAEFKANNGALLIGLILSFFGFILLAPGGVYIRGATRSQHGKIALAGPLMNVVLAVLFILAGNFSAGALMTEIAQFGAQINSLLGIFNLIPIFPFDGRSVWQWNKAAYLLSAAAAGALTLFSLAV